MTQGEILDDEDDEVLDDKKAKKNFFNCGVKLNGQLISTDPPQPHCLPLYKCLASLLRQFKLMFILDEDQESIVNEMGASLNCIVKEIENNKH